MNFLKTVLVIFLVLIFCYGAFRATFFNNVRILKKAGFFQTFEQKSTYALGMYFLAENKRYLRQYSYLMNPSLSEIILKDKSKSIEIYNEIFSTQEYKFYAKMVHHFGLISDGKFNPTNIKEEWATVDGPIELSYHIGGREVRLYPKRNKGWLDQDIVDHLQKELECRGVYLRAPQQLSNIFMRLSETEELILQNKFGWEFTPKNRD